MNSMAAKRFTIPGTCTIPSLLLPPAMSFAPLLMLLLFALGGCPCPTLAQDCSADVSIGASDGVANITTQPVGADDKMYVTLFVHPKPGFKGISLVDVNNRGDYSYESRLLWVPLDSTCFPFHADWWQLRAGVEIKKHKISSLSGIGASVSAGTCSVAPYKAPISVGGVVQVRAHGTSEWRLCPSSACGRTIPPKNAPWPPPILTCSHSPAAKSTAPARSTTPAKLTTHLEPTTPSVPTFAVVGVVVNVVLVVIVAVLVMVMVVFWRRRRLRMTATEGMCVCLSVSLVNCFRKHVYNNFCIIKNNCSAENINYSILKIFFSGAVMYPRKVVIVSWPSVFSRT